MRRLFSPIVVFGMAVVLLCWLGVFYQSQAERADVVRLAIERGDSAARLFENDMVRQLKGVDTALLVIRQAYEDDPEHFDLVAFIRKANLTQDVATEVGLVRADGRIVARTTGPIATPIYINDRLHFRAQVDPPVDQLFIGDVVTLRTTGLVAFQVSRRLRTRDGRFDGILGAQIDPKFVEQFSRTLDLGRDSNISVRGLDGKLRASYGFKTPPEKLTAVLANATARSPQGHFFGGGVSDGVPRLVSYRTISAYPLVITVGETEKHIFRNSEHRRIMYIGIAAAITLLIGGFVTLVLNRQIRLETLLGQFNTALTNMPQGLSMFDKDDRLIAFNPRWAEIYNLHHARVGMTFRDALAAGPLAGRSGDEVEDAVNRTKRLVAGNTRSLYTYDIDDGRTVAVTLAPRPEGGWVAVHEDITDRRISERKIEQLAHFDALTGLANRHLFKDRVEDALAKQRRLDIPFAVLMLDLDMFKSVNDSLGHQAGDILLAQVADRIKSTVREVDVACRLGGDEFAVIVLPGEGEFADGCALLAQRLIETIAAPVEIDGQSVVVGCSIGVALVPEHGRRINEVLRNADLALYKAKNDGRSCFRIYSERMICDAERRHILEIDLRAAIWDDRLELHYQPVFDLQTGRVVSVEALARWNHKTKGMISPSEFIPVAEEAGLISDLANLLLVKACQDATRMPDDVTVAFNLSPVQFAKSDVIDATVFALADSGLPEGRLEFEITEGVLMKETERNIAALRALKNIGVSIALDDFGVGFSSLSYLTAFPFDKVKIDKSFIDKLDRPETVAVVDAIVRLAGSLQLAVVAEGIETEDQLARVRALGIRLGQGFLFSTAVPFDRLSFAAIDIASAPRPLRRKAG